MIAGDVHKIETTGSLFRDIITSGALYVDKSRFIEHFLLNSQSIIMITRPRKLGSSMNLDMLRLFLTDEEDTRELFKDLYISSDESKVWDRVNSAPVFYFDLKQMGMRNYKKQIYNQVIQHIKRYLDVSLFDGMDKMLYENYVASDGEDNGGLELLTRLVFDQTQKRSYILIDEYDDLLLDVYKSDEYRSIRSFIWGMMSHALKGNPYLARGVVTGVMRLSVESMFSGFNNFYAYDVFRDHVFSKDFGLTEQDMDELDDYLAAAGEQRLDRDKIKKWYGGIRIDETMIYPIHSVMNFLSDPKREYIGFWRKSGILDMAANMMVSDLDKDRVEVIISLLHGGTVTEEVDDQISLERLARRASDDAFYSLLVQAGYLAIQAEGEPTFRGTESYLLMIPNKELELVWQDFIIEQFERQRKGKSAMVKLVPYDVSFEAVILSQISEFFGFHQALVHKTDWGNERLAVPDDDSLATLAEWQIPPNALFVIVSGDVSVGFIRINYRGPHVAWIEDVFVDTAFRGRGIASSAIAAVETIIMNTPGYTAVCLDVSPRNETALRLYHKLGYVDLSLITMRKEFDSSKRDRPIRFLDMDFKF